MAQVAYVMGAREDRDLARRVAAGAAPNVEYLLFLERYGGVLVDHGTRDGLASRAATMLRRFGGDNVETADTALRMRNGTDRFIATGEDVGIWLALLSLLSRDGRPINIITHGSYLGSPRFRHVMRILSRMNNVSFLPLATSISRRLTGEFGVPAERVHDAGYGTDIAFFVPKGARLGRPLVTSAGLARRDYQTLLQAVGEEEVDVTIAAGSAWYEQALDIDPVSTASNVTVRPHPYPELRDLYARSSVVVVPLYPSEHACGYSVIVESMAMGRPVIATRTACPSDFFVDGESGLYVPPRRPDVLRKRLRELLTEPCKAERIGAAARERVCANFSLDAYVTRLAEAAGVN
jgi:glycosyltransferase involved in cell wall biosynthesis